MINVVFAPTRITSQATTVVVDVLRATSTIVTALANGALSVKPVHHLCEARREREKNILLCGERKSIKPKGFDLGNSPLEFKKDIVAGKNIVLTTTNGTRAIRLINAPTILAGSFLNLSAVVEKLITCDEILIVCSGQNNFAALEDVLCAGAIIYKLSRNDIADSARIAVKLWENSMHMDLESVLLSTSHGRELAELGFGEDVAYCSRIDLFNVLPIFREDRFVL